MVAPALPEGLGASGHAACASEVGLLPESELVNQGACGSAEVPCVLVAVKWPVVFCRQVCPRCLGWQRIRCWVSCAGSGAQGGTGRIRRHFRWHG
eukprot:4140658-Heterocapsa_arctica.AAC.1